MTRIPARAAAALAALASAVPLAGAFASEWWAGLVPCPLCLVDRWPWRVAIALSLIAVLLPRRWVRGMLALVLLVGLASVGCGVLHVGVEWRLWESPLPECQAPRLGNGSIADRLRNMPAHPSKACEDPVYLVEAIPVSFAELDLIYALAFSVGVATLLVMSGEKRR
jgi:disulfide bond formation protein DsbB